MKSVSQLFPCEIDRMKREDIISFIAGHKTEFEERFGVKRLVSLAVTPETRAREGTISILWLNLKSPPFCLIGIKQAIEDALGNKVDIVRLRDKMNKTLRHRIELDVVYV